VKPEFGTTSDVFVWDVKLYGANAGSVPEPVIEDSDHFLTENRGRTQNMSIVNGSVSHHVAYRYHVYPEPSLEPGTYELPKAYFELAKGNTALKTLTVEILKDAGAKVQKAASNFDFIQHVDNTKPYVGEQILYQTEVVYSTSLSSVEFNAVELRNFWREGFGEKKIDIRSVGNRNTQRYTIREALFATIDGELQIPRRILTGRAPDPNQAPTRRRSVWDPLTGLDDFFSFGRSRRTIPIRLIAEALTLNVKPLPPAPEKNLGYIPVGQVRLSSSVDKVNVKQGDSITMKISLVGDANLRPYELPKLEGDLADKFKIYTDKPEIQTGIQNGRIIFQKTFTLAIIPQQADLYELPRIKVVTFDPVKQKYEILQISKHVLNVTPDENAGRLVVSAPETAPADITDNKQQIEVLSEDLLPQHTGPETYARKKATGGILTASLFLVAPLVALGVFFITQAKQKLNLDPKLIAKRHAKQKAFAALGEIAQGDSVCLEQLGVAFRTYLGDMFSAPGDSLTSDEAEQLVSRETREREIGKKTKELLARVERLRFSGNISGNNGEGNQMLESARSLIDEIDDNVRLK